MISTQISLPFDWFRTDRSIKYPSLLYTYRTGQKIRLSVHRTTVKNEPILTLVHALAYRGSTDPICVIIALLDAELSLSQLFQSMPSSHIFSSTRSFSKISVRAHFYQHAWLSCARGKIHSQLGFGRVSSTTHSSHIDPLSWSSNTSLKMIWNSRITCFYCKCYGQFCFLLV